MFFGIEKRSGRGVEVIHQKRTCVGKDKEAAHVQGSHPLFQIRSDSRNSFWAWWWKCWGSNPGMLNKYSITELHLQPWFLL